LRAKFGVCLPNFGKHLSVDAITTVAAEAEEMGFSSVWATDHLIIPSTFKYPYGNILEALTTMTLAATATEEVNIGSSVIVLPMREPVSVAKALAAIDVISRGRVIAGFGAGWCEGEFKNLGQNFRNRGRRLDEAITLFRTLMRGGSVTFKGKYYTVHEGLFEPKPVRPGGPPVWVGGNSKAAFDRAVRLGDGWHFTGLSVEKAASLLENTKLREGFTVSGRFTVDLSGKSPKVTRASSGEERVILSGVPDEVSDMIGEYIEKGVEYFVLYFGDKPVQEYVKEMQAFSRDVIPSYT
jgi:probable F420-dependent oxidoreductase